MANEVRHFDRHANMGEETRSTILEYTNYPILKEYYVGNDDSKYREVKSALDKEGYSRSVFSNYLFGLFDGYDYSDTDRFKEELAKIERADPEFHEKITRIYEEIKSYPTTDVPNRGSFSEGGSVDEFWKMFDGYEMNSLIFEGVVGIDGKEKVLWQDGEKIHPSDEQIQELRQEYFEREFGAYYSGGGEIGIGSHVEFRYGREEDDETRTGYIVDDLGDDNFEIHSGVRQILVPRSKIVGLAPIRKRKRFGIFNEGGQVEETVWKKGNWAITRKGSGRDATYYADNGERAVYTEVDRDGDVSFDDDLPQHVQERVIAFYEETREEPFDRWEDEALWELKDERDDSSLEITDEESHRAGFPAYIEIGGDTGDFMVFESEDDAEEYAKKQVAEDLEHEPDLFSQDWLIGYISNDDAEEFFRPIYTDWSEGYVEDIENEEGTSYANRLIDELVEYGIMSEDDALSDDAREIADDRKDTYVQMMVDDKIGEGDGGYEYYKSNFGEAEATKLIIQNNLIDIDDASEGAVNTDGIAHFLSRYDGQTIYLPSGAVAYRTN